MKKFLLAATALTLGTTAVWAMDDDDHHRTRIAAASGSRVIIADDGPVIEIRGEDGERTIHIERDGEESTLTINGQEIVVQDGVVLVDGQAIEASEGNVVIIEGMEIRVIDGHDVSAFGPEFTAHMAERAEHMARLHTELGAMREMNVVVDVEGIESEVMVALEAALAGIDQNVIENGEDWDDLSEEERAEVRAELEEARAEIRRAMEEVRTELRAAHHGEAAEARERVRVEIRHAMREMAEAEREMAQAHREMAEAEREMARHQRRMRWVEAHGEHDEAREIRIEEDEDGNRRVWIDGEEVEGDDMMVLGAHGGMPHGVMMMNHDVRVEEDEDGNRRVFIDGAEVDGAHVMRMHHGDRLHAMAMTGHDIRIEEDDDGNRRVFIDGEEVDGAHVMRMHHGDGEHGTAMMSREVRIEEDDEGNRRIWIDGEEVDAEEHAGMMHWRHRTDGGRHVQRERVRVEEDDSGRRRVFVDDEEQTGDDLIEWLNRIETQRLAGAPSGDGERHMERRVMRFEAEDGEHQTIEVDGARRVVVIRRGDETREIILDGDAELEWIEREDDSEE